jgi:hypothetical protein
MAVVLISFSIGDHRCSSVFIGVYRWQILFSMALLSHGEFLPITA